MTNPSDHDHPETPMGEAKKAALVTIIFLGVIILLTGGLLGVVQGEWDWLLYGLVALPCITLIMVAFAWLRAKFVSLFSFPVSEETKDDFELVSWYLIFPMTMLGAVALSFLLFR